MQRIRSKLATRGTRGFIGIQRQFKVILFIFLKNKLIYILYRLWMIIMIKPLVIKNSQKR